MRILNADCFKEIKGHQLMYSADSLCYCNYWEENGKM